MVTLTNNTNSTSTSTGALVLTQGGLGVNGNVNVGGTGVFGGPVISGVDSINTTVFPNSATFVATYYSTLTADYPSGTAPSGTYGTPTIVNNTAQFVNSGVYYPAGSFGSTYTIRFKFTPLALQRMTIYTNDCYNVVISNWIRITMNSSGSIVCTIVYTWTSSMIMTMTIPVTLTIGTEYEMEFDIDFANGLQSCFING